MKRMKNQLNHKVMLIVGFLLFTLPMSIISQNKKTTKQTKQISGQNLQQRVSEQIDPTVSTVTPFWTEDFGQSEKDGNQGLLAEEAKTDNGNWTLTKLDLTGQKPNKWYISSMECGLNLGDCSKSFSEDNTNLNNTLHVSYHSFANKPDPSATYWKNESSMTDSRIESPMIDCRGKQNIVISFDYFSGGIVGQDFFSIYLFDGTNWNLISTFGPSETSTLCASQNKNSWTSSGGFPLPIIANNNPEVRLGFRWRNESSVAGNSLIRSVAIDNIKVFGDDITPVVNGDPTAKTIKSLNSKIENNKPQLTFKSTASIITVERSKDGTNFSKVSTISPNETGQYTWTDQYPVEGISYYRIVEKRGGLESVSQSVVTEVSPENKINFTIYPNPNSGEFVVDFGGIENNFKVDLLLLDSDGQKVYETEFDIDSLKEGKFNVIPNGQIKNGRYYCTLIIEGIRYTSIVIIK